MAQRFFSGHESWVFTARHVDELCGHHAELVGQSVLAHERMQQS